MGNDNEFNPRFGFFLPVVKEINNLSILELEEDSYQGYTGPIPLEEILVEEDTSLAYRFDSVLSFGTDSNSLDNPKSGDMVVLVEYRPNLKYKHALYSHEPRLSRKFEYNVCYHLPSSKYIHGYYVVCTMVHNFVKSIVMEAVSEK